MFTKLYIKRGADLRVADFNNAGNPSNYQSTILPQYQIKDTGNATDVYRCRK